MNGFTGVIKDFAVYFGFGSPLDILKAVIDIGIVSYVTYKLVLLVRETRAVQLLKGIVFIVVAAYISDLLGLETISWILRNSIQVVGFALVVLFQPELRRGLERIGRSKIKTFFGMHDESILLKTTTLIEEIIKSVTRFSKTFTGSLIVIERETKIGEIINNGIPLDADVTSELLISIFTPNTPLHDGAIVIRDSRIKAAACFLPLTDNPDLSKELGTRHRAALGITEVSDAICIIVSEETGKISFALNGGLTRNLTAEALKKALYKNLLEEMNNNNSKLSLWEEKDK